MSTFARKGLSAILLVVLFAAPVAAAAPGGERVESREAGVVAGWVGELVEWLGGWLRWNSPDGASEHRSELKAGTPVQSMSGANDNGGGYDPNG